MMYAFDYIDGPLVKILTELVDNNMLLQELAANFCCDAVNARASNLLNTCEVKRKPPFIFTNLGLPTNIYIFGVFGVFSEKPYSKPFECNIVTFR